jgi:hypothetical protein
MMTESLVVDPARLKAAGIALRDQVLPASPPPISATGSDSVSTAINETLPIIESPVVDGFPDAQTALTNTASKIVTAADMYAETDQLLGEHVGTVQFTAALDAETADKKSDETADKKTNKTSSPAVAANLNQLSAMTQATQPVTQGLQSVISSVQQLTGGTGNAGTSTAKLADDTKKDDTQPDESTTGDAQLGEVTTADSDGAASGKQGSESVPAQPPTGRRPETTQSELEL